MATNNRLQAELRQALDHDWPPGTLYLCAGCTRAVPATHEERRDGKTKWFLVPGLGWTCGECRGCLSAVTIDGHVFTTRDE